MQWATRARPHVDRCGSAWLIKRFIDPQASFAFAPPGAEFPLGATPFDVPGAKAGHRGESCTFETLVADHKLGSDPGVAALARLVHDIDFHLLELPESPGLDAILRGLVLAEPDDQKVLERAWAVFDALYARARAQAER